MRIPWAGLYIHGVGNIVNFCRKSLFIWVPDRAIVIIERQQEIVGARSTGIIFDDIQWHLTRGQGHGTLPRRKSRSCSEVSRVQRTVVDQQGLYQNRTRKFGIFTVIFIAKTTGRCFTPVAEIKPKKLQLSIKLLREYTVYKRNVLATTMRAWKVQWATCVTKWQY